MTTENDPVYRLIHREEAHNHAAMKCRQLGIKKSDKKFMSCYEEAFDDYLSGIKKATSVMENPCRTTDIEENPTTPKVPSYIWDLFIIFQDGGFFDNMKKQTGDFEDVTEKRNQFKGAIGSIVNTYLELSQGLHTKSKKNAQLGERGEISDFQYISLKAKDNSNKVAKTKEESSEDMLQVEINRYVRLYVLAQLMPFLTGFFNSLTMENIGKEILNNKEKFFGKKEITFKDLNNVKMRTEFVSNLLKIMKESNESQMKKEQKWKYKPE